MLGLILSLLLETAPIPHSVTVEAPQSEAQRHPASPDMSSIIARIRLAVDAGRYDEADALLQRHHDLLASSYRDDMTVLQAELMLAKGDPRGAEQAVAAVGPEGRFRCQVLLIRGMAAHARGDADRSVTQLGTLTNECSVTWRVWDVLGQLMAGLGEQDASRFAFQKALASQDCPASVSAHYGHSLIQFGSLDEASAMLAKALVQDPANNAAQRDQDYLVGLRGFEPERRDREGDTDWARRLADAADGARHAGRSDLARALYAQALLASPQYDARLLEAASEP